METVLFILFGAIAVCGAIMVVTRKHPMVSALYLILTLFAVAALFVLRQAHFLAAVQVIVYAGAVVVLFVFVIMLINVPDDPPARERATTTRVLGVFAAGLFILESAVLARRLLDAERSGGRGGNGGGRGAGAVHRLPARLRDHLGAAPGRGDRGDRPGEEEDMKRWNAG